MTSYEFEVAAKNAVLKMIGEYYADDEIRTTRIENIHMVWFAHVLGHKKAILIDGGVNNRIYEVTYNNRRNEMYVDSYEKNHNILVTEMDTTVHKQEEDEPVSFEIGDEVAFLGSPGNSFIITEYDPDNYIGGIAMDGSTHFHDEKENFKNWVKTGRHFDIIRMLYSLKEDH